MTITEFLLARTAEDEARATAVAWAMLPNEGSTANIVLAQPGSAADASLSALAGYDPGRVLAECLARRALIDVLEKAREPIQAHDLHAAIPGLPVDSARGKAALYGYNEGAAFVAQSTLLVLALAYAEHPDFNREWLTQ